MNESETLPQPKEDTAKARAPRLSAQKALPQSGADTLVKIIKGYAIASNGGQSKINYKDVASVAGLAPTLVSGNNKFLLESQFLTSPQYGYYIPTADAVRFARETAWDEGGAKAHLRKTMTSSWYGQVAVQNFALRAKLTRAELKRSLAIKCGASEADSNALEYLIDFMVYTELVITDEKGLLSRGQTDDENGEKSPLVDMWDNALAADQASGFGTMQSPEGLRAESKTVPKISVHLHIHNFNDLTSANFSRLKAWLKALSTIDDAELHLEIPSSEEGAAKQEAPTVSDNI
jgi:hypothetical protein